MEHRIIEPLDVVVARGNRLFADAGHGEVTMPPWPSTLAGALRSRILVDRDVPLLAFRDGGDFDSEVQAVLGTSASTPGTFRVALVGMARRVGGRTEVLVPVPADVVVGNADGSERLVGHSLVPRSLATELQGVRCGSSLPSLSTLCVAQRSKSAGAAWIRIEDLARHLSGEKGACKNLVAPSELWSKEVRLGIGLDATSRSATAGLLYTTEVATLHSGVGVFVGVAGSGTLLPTGGLVRLGGDGRGASISTWEPPSGVRMPWDVAPGAGHFTIVMASPGVFPGGWRFPGVEEKDGELVLACRNLRARLVAASIPRHEIVSGWDLAVSAPKPAQRVVPRGSVYWFETMEGDPLVLKSLISDGLDPLIESLGLTVAETALYRRRAAEGFNNVWLGSWSADGKQR